MAERGYAVSLTTRAKFLVEFLTHDGIQKLDAVLLIAEPAGDDNAVVKAGENGKPGD